MKNFNRRVQDFKKELLKIKGGDFSQWYEGLSPIEKILYRKGFKELQTNNEKHR